MRAQVIGRASNDRWMVEVQRIGGPGGVYREKVRLRNKVQRIGGASRG